MLFEWWCKADDRAIERRVRKLVPEVESQHVREIHNQANEIARRRTLWWTMLGGMLVAAGVGAIVVGFSQPRFGLKAAMLGVALGGLLSAVFYVPKNRIYRREVRRLARAFGHRLCIHCGCDLRSFSDPEARCPECGTERI